MNREKSAENKKKAAKVSPMLICYGDSDFPYFTHQKSEKLAWYSSFGIRVGVRQNSNSRLKVSYWDKVLTNKDDFIPRT